MPTHHLNPGRAYQIRLAFQDLYHQTSAKRATGFIRKRYFWATHSRLPPTIEAARTIQRHADGILRWFHRKIANGLTEGINSLVQAAKAKARGYRSTRNLQAVIYLLAGARPRAPRMTARYPHQTAKNPLTGRGKVRNLRNERRKRIGEWLAGTVSYVDKVAAN